VACGYPGRAPLDKSVGCSVTEIYNGYLVSGSLNLRDNYLTKHFRRPKYCLTYENKTHWKVSRSVELTVIFNCQKLSLILQCARRVLQIFYLLRLEMPTMKMTRNSPNLYYRYIFCSFYLTRIIKNRC